MVWPVKWNLDVYLSSEGLNAGGQDILMGSVVRELSSPTQGGMEGLPWLLDLLLDLSV